MQEGLAFLGSEKCGKSRKSEASKESQGDCATISWDVHRANFSWGQIWRFLRHMIQRHTKQRHVKQRQVGQQWLRIRFLIADGYVDWFPPHPAAGAPEPSSHWSGACKH